MEQYLPGAWVNESWERQGWHQNHQQPAILSSYQYVMEPLVGSPNLGSETAGIKAEAPTDMC
jgi:hypothetical protein